MNKTIKSNDARNPVKLRYRLLKGGRKSIYLDIYQDGKRMYEFLGLYLLPETHSLARRQNASILRVATEIKEKRNEMLHDNTHYLYSKHKSMMLLSWMRRFMEYQGKKGCKDVRQIGYTSELLSIYAGSNVPMKDVDVAFCRGFVFFLRNIYKNKLNGQHISAFTARNYCRCFNSALNAAVRMDVIKENPFRKMASSEKISMPESQREYLTIDEIKRLIATECSRDIVKRAYLFSCYCGLRISDIESMKWNMIFDDGGQLRLKLVQKKTSQPLYLPLSKHAIKWMPEKGNASMNDFVFASMPSQSHGNRILKRWAKEAGVNKKLSYHTARHTFATMMLTLGADLFTTSKLLGHKKVATTQIYAKIVNTKKDEAVNLVNSVFDE